MLRGVVAALAVLALSAPVRAQEGPSIAFGGDVLYDAPLAYQLRHRAREIGRARALAEVFADLSATIGAADLAIVNLEVPVSPRYRERDPIEDLPVFRAPEDFLDALATAGVDAVVVANNHAYDQGGRGLADTLNALDDRSLGAVGAGHDPEHAARAVVLERGRARIAIAAWTEGSNHRPESAEGSSPCIAFLRDGTIAESLRAAREDAHLVIATFHWTHEDLVDPRPMMRAIAREAAEAGADLVVGHGTHVPGRTEMVETSDGRRVQVLSSLGNLVASMDEPAGTLESGEVGVRDAPLAIVRTRWRRGRLAIEGVDFVHHWIARPASAPWLDAGRIAVSRPVSIEAELARIASAGCGVECDDRASEYRRRVLLTTRAMRAIDAAEPAPPIVASALEVPARAAPRRSAPARTPPARIPDGDPRLAPYLRGARVEATFAGAREEHVDEAAIARVAALLREDRSLRCEVIVTAEDEALAELRARRVKGLIAIRGPSRSRFTTRGRRGAPSVTIRLAR